MDEEKKSLAESLYEQKNFVFALLSVPIFGMAIAVVLILYKRPSSTIPVLGIILFLAAQYILMMYFWYKRLEGILSKKTQESKSEPVDFEDIMVQEVPLSENVLAPEEKRVFPVEEE